ncbi:MAG: LysR family transcriptional regulator [Microbacteriaceae bacterium]|nr:LysR family transcriptional regulator [Microbacteriaceae bacterium]
MLNLQRLRLLRELHRRGTMAEVARALAYTPSTVSQQLALLERETGTALLERVGRRVRLTDAAIALVEHTEAVLARLELAESDLQAARPDAPATIRVAAFPTVLASLAPTALTLLAERHPQLRVELHDREVEEAYDELRAHAFDLVVGESYPGAPEPPHPGIELAPLRPDALRLVLPLEGPLRRVPGEFAELAEAPWAFDTRTSRMGVWALGRCRAAGFEPRILVETPEPLLQAHLVRSGHVVAIIAELIAAPLLEGTRLVELPGDPHRLLFTAVRAGSAGRPAIRAVREALADAARMQAPPRPADRLAR